jgi:hypothetical protein
MHIVANINDQGTKNDDTIDDEVDHNQDWGEESIVIKKLHIIEIVQQTIIKYLCINRLKKKMCKCVNMHQNLAMIEEQPR